MKKLLIIIFFGVIFFGGCGHGIGSKFDLSDLESPIILKGDSLTAYRDPAVLFHNNRIYLFFTVVEIIGDSVYSYTAQSESDDLIDWSSPRRITKLSQNDNFSSPGNVIRFKDEWIMCLQSYPRPNYTKDEMPRYGNKDSRLYIIRSNDLITWTEPELLKVKGNVPFDEMGRMIDPYLIEDKDEPGKWWCFYKQNGVSMSYSYDLKNWTFFGFTESGENVCVLTENNEYILFHSPKNGIGIRKSRNLQNWVDWGDTLRLGQDKWDWAKGRITAGTVVNMNEVEGINNYLMFYHGSGPKTEKEGDFDINSSIGIAWSKNLIDWYYPKTTKRTY